MAARRDQLVGPDVSPEHGPGPAVCKNEVKEYRHARFSTLRRRRPSDGAPDSELCRRATALAAELSPAFLFNHCARSFLFADAIGKRDGLEYDRELLYLSNMLHDLGLTAAYVGADQRFELEGADRARPSWSSTDSRRRPTSCGRDRAEHQLRHCPSERPGNGSGPPGRHRRLPGHPARRRRPERVAQIVHEYPRQAHLLVHGGPGGLRAAQTAIRTRHVFEIVVHSHAPDVHVPTWRMSSRRLHGRSDAEETVRFCIAERRRRR